MKRDRVILLIRDGWGYRESCVDNAICSVATPNTDRIMREYPNVLIDASGNAVGLPKGYQGNSEVGHSTIGSGRINWMSLEIINRSIDCGDFFKIDEFVQAIQNCKDRGTKLHLIGLLQSEGVHAHEDHLYALLRLCQMHDFQDVLVHVVTDGRDAPVNDSIKHIELLIDRMRELSVGEIASVCGRYYAMDRNKAWERTRKEYDCVVNADAEREFTDALEFVRGCHKAKETDEFIKPSKRSGYEGVKAGDSFIFYNFRTDRTRQLTQAMVEDDFIGWERKPLDVFFVGMTQFYKPMNAKVAFKDNFPDKILGEVVSDAGLSQLRISETEKYAHVTFFFNSQIESPFKGEERIMIESPKVATYDLLPEMSIYEINERLIAEIRREKFDLIVVNFVNGDMVGHTGLVPAIEKAVKAVDDCVGQTVEAGLEHGYSLLIFADHGNAEDQTDAWRTSHTTNPVPLILVTGNEGLRERGLMEGGGLADIAPTALEVLGIAKPDQMSGRSLLK